MVPAFFGLGVAWHAGTAGAGELERILAPWDRNPLLARLEANRVRQLATHYERLADCRRLQRRQARQEAVLRRLLESSAFAVAERLSALRVRARIAPGSSVVSKDEIRATLD